MGLGGSTISATIVIRAVNLARGTLAELDREMASAGKSGTSMGTRIEQGARAVAKTSEIIGVATGAVASYSLYAAAHFQHMMETVRGNTNMTAAQFKQFNSGVLSIAQQTPAAIDQIAQGYMRAVNEGFLPGMQAMQVTMAGVKSAVATNADPEDVVNALAITMHAYQATSDQAMHYMDVLHLIAQKGNMTMAQLSPVIGRVVAYASQVGVPLEDIGAAMDVLTRNGLSATQSATQLYNAFIHIVHPTAAAQEEIDALTKSTGVDLSYAFTQAGLKAEGLFGVMKTLKEATRGNLAEMGTILPNTRGLMGGVMLTHDIATYKALLRDMYTQAPGSTQRSFDWMMKTFDAQLGVLKNNVEVLAITIGNALIPVAEQLIHDIMPDVQKAIGFVQDHPDLVASWAKLGIEIGLFGFALNRVIGPAKILFSLLAGFSRFIGLGTMLKALGGSLFGGAAVKTAATGAAAVTGAEAGQLTMFGADEFRAAGGAATVAGGQMAAAEVPALGLGDALAAIADAAIPVTLGLTAIAAASVVAYFKWKGFHDLVNETFSTGTSKLPTIIEDLKSLPSYIGGGIAKIAQAAHGVADAVGKIWVQDPISHMGGDTLGNIVGGNFGKLGRMAGDAFKSGWLQVGVATVLTLPFGGIGGPIVKAMEMAGTKLDAQRRYEQILAKNHAYAETLLPMSDPVANAGIWGRRNVSQVQLGGSKVGVFPGQQTMPVIDKAKYVASLAEIVNTTRLAYNKIGDNFHAQELRTVNDLLHAKSQEQRIDDSANLARLSRQNSAADKQVKLWRDAQEKQLINDKIAGDHQLQQMAANEAHQYNLAQTGKQKQTTMLAAEAAHQLAIGNTERAKDIESQIQSIEKSNATLHDGLAKDLQARIQHREHVISTAMEQAKGVDDAQKNETKGVDSALNAMGITGTKTVTDMATAIVKAMHGAAVGSDTEAGNLKNKVLQQFQDMSSQAVGHSIIPDMVTAIIASLTNMAVMAGAKAAVMSALVIAQFASLAAQAVGFGVQVGASYAAGIASEAGAVTAAAQTLNAAAAGAMKRHSPPRLDPGFDTYEFGVRHGAAYAAGMKSTKGLVFQAAKDLNSAGMAAFIAFHTPQNQINHPLGPLANESPQAIMRDFRGMLRGAMSQIAMLPPQLQKAIKPELDALTQKLDRYTHEYLRKVAQENNSYHDRLKSLLHVHVETLRHYLAVSNIHMSAALARNLVHREFLRQVATGSRVAFEQHALDAFIKTNHISNSEADKLRKEYLSHSRAMYNWHIHELKLEHHRHLAALKDGYTQQVQQITNALKVFANPGQLWDNLTTQVDNMVKQSIGAVSLAITEGHTKGKGFSALISAAGQAARAQYNMGIAANKAAYMVAMAAGDWGTAMDTATSIADNQLTQAESKYALDLINHTGNLGDDAKALQKAAAASAKLASAMAFVQGQVLDTTDAMQGLQQMIDREATHNLYNFLDNLNKVMHGQPNTGAATVVATPDSSTKQYNTKMITAATQQTQALTANTEAVHQLLDQQKQIGTTAHHDLHDIDAKMGRLVQIEESASKHKPKNSGHGHHAAGRQARGGR